MEDQERRKVVCPAYGQKVEAVVRNGRIKGYCTAARQYVDFPVQTKSAKESYRQNLEYRAKLCATAKKMWQDPEYRAKQKAALKRKGTGISPS